MLSIYSLVRSHLTLGSCPGSGLQICFDGPYSSLKNISVAFKNQESSYNNPDSWLMWKHKESHVHGHMVQWGSTSLRLSRKGYVLFRVPLSVSVPVSVPEPWIHLGLYSLFIQRFCKHILCPCFECEGRCRRACLQGAPNSEAGSEQGQCQQPVKVRCRVVRTL